MRQIFCMYVVLVVGTVGSTVAAKDIGSRSAVEGGEADEDLDEPVLCDDVPVPLSLIDDNIATTDFSGVVRIETATVEGQNGQPPSSTGYVNHKYTVTVVETIYGNPSEQFIYRVWTAYRYNGLLG